MIGNDFLTRIARKHSARIETVAFCGLLGKFSEVRRRARFEAYSILIDPKKQTCPHRILFSVHHEIGHVVLRHLGERFFERGRDYIKEDDAAADRWAFKAMGMTEKTGRAKMECRACYVCMVTKSKTCLKGYGTGKRHG